MKNLIKCVAGVIWNNDYSRILLAKRPHDCYCPDVYGLIGGLVNKNESFEDAMIRAGMEKLGVELEIFRDIGEGRLEREEDELYMKEYEVKIIKGIPKVPQDHPEVTQYLDLKWGRLYELEEAYNKGSLCSRIFKKNLK